MFSAPEIPYLQLPELVIIPKGFFGGFPSGAFSIKPFGTLVAIGVYVGSVLTTRLGKRLGLHERVLTSFAFWVVGIGFLGGHMLDVIFYYPGQVLRDPLSLFRVWEGLSSFGGFSGAIIGGFLWKWRYKADILPYADVVASSFPAGWVFGRSGCSVAHDHPGLASDAWFAVQYPGGGRFDLGLYEMLLTIPLALAFLWLRRKPRPWGFYVGAITIAYAPVRFALDFPARGRADRRERWLDRRGGPSLRRAHARAMGVLRPVGSGRVLLHAHAAHRWLARCVRRSPAAPGARRAPGRSSHHARILSAPGAMRATSGKRPGVSPSMSISTSARGTRLSASINEPRAERTPG